ncbi:hypothetical protein NE237_001220 [Protea cynaroides]|uniref:Uncharacterized protein n=1 Tax=Protea cynaroides TaxID=273540 RepID=A0A9Q0KT38_9MAGN|nr:hypothetical protein NE237_001220 [Protea cynaroides]
MRLRISSGSKVTAGGAVSKRVAVTADSRISSVGLYCGTVVRICSVAVDGQSLIVESRFPLLDGGTRRSVNQVLDRFSAGKSGDPLLHERSMELKLSLDLEGSDHRSARREVAGRAAECLLEGLLQPMVNFLAGVAVLVKLTTDNKVSGVEIEHRSVDATIAGLKADGMVDRRGQPTVGFTVDDMGTVATGN